MPRLLLIILSIAALAYGAGGDSRSWSNLSRLTAGERIAVVETGGKSSRGSFVRFTEQAIELRSDGRTSTIAKADVARVYRPSGHRLRNVLIGLAAGAGVALATDQTVGRYLRNESNPENARALIWTLPIAAGGAAGAAFPARETVYRR